MIRSIVRPFVALFRARAAPMGRATGKNALMPRETTPAVTGCIAHRSIRCGEFGRTLRGNRCACLAMHTVRCSGRSSRGAGPSCRDLAILGCCGRCKIRRDRARISANVTMNSTGVIGRSVVSCGSGVVLCCTVAVSIPAPRMLNVPRRCCLILIKSQHVKSLFIPPPRFVIRVANRRAKNCFDTGGAKFLYDHPNDILSIDPDTNIV